MLDDKQKAHIVLSCMFRPGEVDQRLYAWKMRGTNDVKLIAAINDESAARIAVQARIDVCEMSEDHALEAVLTEDYLAPIDPDMFFQGDAPLWKGADKLEGAVDKV